MKKMRRFMLLVLIFALCGSICAGCAQNNEATTTTTTTAPAEVPPTKEYTAGTVTKLEYDENTMLTYSEGSTLEDFEKYCAGLGKLGLEKVFDRDTVDVRCVAYLDGQEYIYAYYAKRIQEVRVTVGPKDTFCAGDCTDNTGVTATPTLTMVGQKPNKNNGQGFVFVLPDGRLILQDGGNWFDDIEPDLIYNAIKTVAPDPENIVIAGWFISHPHSDHIGAFLKFVTDCGQDETIHVQRVIRSFAGEEWYDFEREDGTVEDSGHYVLELEQLCSTQLPDTQLIQAHNGQIFDFGGAQVEILHTVEDLLPAKDLGYINSSSMVIRVHIAGQTVLLLADTTSTTATTLVDMYEDSLYSDMVQVAHHGMWSANEMLYFYTMADVLLWPTLPSVAKNWLMDEPMVAALKYAKDLYIAGTTLTTLELPYSMVNNKQEVLSTLMPAQ